jgi:DNA (cytosine-5)-methyltransferase 1
LSWVSAVELCAGGGGQALGLERAGFEHVALIDIEPHCCATLKLNRPDWNVIQADLKAFDASNYHGIDLLAGGLPCPPFSVAGKQLGHEDERDLFPAALRLVDEIRPRALMIENVRGLFDPGFAPYREHIVEKLAALGYRSDWQLLNAADFGVPQSRPRTILIAFKDAWPRGFQWPAAGVLPAPTVGDVVGDLMIKGGWEGAVDWCKRANRIAPTIVGGSTKHGGPDLGPTRARKMWAELGVDGLGIADAPPPPGFVGMPKLTVRMVARIQGFPDDWQFSGRKTAMYRQVGNALPPPLAYAVGECIMKALGGRAQLREAV